MQLKAIPLRLLHPPAMATGEKKAKAQRIRGWKDGGQKGEAEAEKALSDKKQQDSFLFLKMIETEKDYLWDFSQ